MKFKCCPSPTACVAYPQWTLLSVDSRPEGQIEGPADRCLGRTCFLVPSWFFSWCPRRGEGGLLGALLQEPRLSLP